MKKLLTPFLLLGALALSQGAHALEIMASNTDKEIQQEEFNQTVKNATPPDIRKLGDDYRLIALLETTPYKDNSLLYFYSVMLHRQVTEQATGKKYWIATGGVRSNGVTRGGEELLHHVRNTMEAGAKSFRLDQN